MRHAFTAALLAGDDFEHVPPVAHPRLTRATVGHAGTSATAEALHVLRAQTSVFDAILFDLKRGDTDSNTIVRLPISHVAPARRNEAVTGDGASLISDVAATCEGRARKPRLAKGASNNADKVVQRGVVTPITVMPDHRSEIQELNREWRREMIDALKEVRIQISHLTDTLTKIREEFAKSVELQELEKRIDLMEREHEKDKAKLMGGYIVIQVIVAIGVWLAAHFWK